MSVIKIEKKWIHLSNYVKCASNQSDPAKHLSNLLEYWGHDQNIQIHIYIVQGGPCKIDTPCLCYKHKYQEKFKTDRQIDGQANFLHPN